MCLLISFSIRLYHHCKAGNIDSNVNLLCSNLESPGGGCEWRESWNAYRCKTLQHHMLIIESMDDDSETRRLSPLALTGGDTGHGDYTDLINGPMDHG